MAALDNAQRQLDEFEATGSLYEKELVDGPSTERIGQLQAAVDASDESALEAVPNLGFSLRFSLEDTNAVAVLKLEMPSAYPESDRLVVSCTCAALNRKSEAALGERLGAFLDALDAGEEAVMEVATWYAEASVEAVKQQAAEEAEAATASTPSTAAKKKGKKKGKKVPKTMHKATEVDNLEAMEEFVAKDPGAIEERNVDGWTPIMTAAYNCELRAMQWLLDKGADINAICEDGDTAVHYAAAQGEGDAVRLLITAGCDFTIKDNDGETPLMVAKGKAKAALSKALK